MQIKFPQLVITLRKSLLPVYLISGEDDLQLIEAGDLIKNTAKAQGYLLRDVFNVDKGFDWQQLDEAADNLSIFADKKLIDLKLSTGSPGDGAKVLARFCKQPPEETLLLITAGKISKDSQKSAWFQAIDKVGCILQVWPLSTQEALQWLNAKLQQLGLQLEPNVVKILFDRVEGNLLAAVQEIEKLYVLYGTKKLSQQDLASAVSDNSRFNIFKLVEAALAAQVTKLIKIQASLKAEGIAPSLVLWALTKEIRLIAALKATQQPNEKEQLLKKHNVWGGERKHLLEAASKRLNRSDLNNILLLGAKADRQIKGQQTGDAWESLLQASLLLASVSILANTG